MDAPRPRAPITCSSLRKGSDSTSRQQPMGKRRRLELPVSRHTGHPVAYEDSAAPYRKHRIGEHTEPLYHTVFETSRRSLGQSSPFTVKADNQRAADISIFVHARTRPREVNKCKPWLTNEVDYSESQSILENKRSERRWPISALVAHLPASSPANSEPSHHFASTEPGIRGHGECMTPFPSSRYTFPLSHRRQVILAVCLLNAVEQGLWNQGSSISVPPALPIALGKLTWEGFGRRRNCPPPYFHLGGYFTSLLHEKSRVKQQRATPEEWKCEGTLQSASLRAARRNVAPSTRRRRADFINSSSIKDRGGWAVRPLASHQGEPCSTPGLGHPRIFARRNRAGRCRWSAGFLGDLPFTPPLHSSAAPSSPLVVKET
ncbi:hypothetical protein PR048_033276 [Dryococelus australis]|uniref:Uncharacterized protein n=1 Tax=Dryococelus australis TaxID=614101 RepID=A0ABQ9FZU9_9NEOP|nr:hypothetical protein PR048_033276 [Dryococelus australis]